MSNNNSFSMGSWPWTLCGCWDDD